MNSRMDAPGTPGAGMMPLPRDRWSRDHDYRNGETMDLEDGFTGQLSVQQPNGVWTDLGGVNNVTVQYSGTAPSYFDGAGAALGDIPGGRTSTIQGTLTLMPDPVASGIELDLDTATISDTIAALNTAMTTPVVNENQRMYQTPAVRERRLKRICMALSELFEVLKAGHIATLSSAIPRTAEVAHVWYSKESNYFELVLEDPSFPPIRDGEKPPLIPGPAFGVFEVGWEPMERLLADHDECRALVSSLEPQYATQRDLAAVRSRYGRRETFDERE